MRFLGFSLWFLLSTAAFLSKAAPWVDTDDRYLRSSLKILADAGYLNVPINTYPLMWQPVLSELANSNAATMNDSQLFAFLRVMSAANFAKKTIINSLSLAGSSDALAASGFGQQYQQQAEINFGTEYIGNNWALGIKKQFSANPHHSNNYDTDDNWDGSYVAYTLGNWVLSAAQQQIWWGPAYSSGFSFSNGSRPYKVLKLSRLNSTEPLLTVLEPLGAVNIELLLAEQPGSALLRHAKVLAARVNVKPVSRLELGISVSQLHTVNLVNPAENQLNSDLSYRFPNKKIENISIDSRYSISGNSAGYGELSFNNGNVGWLVGSEYLIANQTAQVLLLAEYKKVADDILDWQSVQHDTPYGQPAGQWLAGMELHYRDGSSIYANLSQASYSANTALVVNTPVAKRSLLAAGYQQSLFDGLLTVDGQLSRDSMIKGGANFSQRIGVRWERRW